jgi:phosphohistidine swiveling domain-containing protein/2-methylisocitrate lyase-like PEP mutase family enzyme
VHRGFVQAPSPTPRAAELLLASKDAEHPDVVLIAHDYGTAVSLASAIQWANVVGIAAVTCGLDAPGSDIPSVVDLPGLTDLIQDDMLVVVDAERGIVMADPDGMAVAQYQTEINRLAPRTRVFIDSVHLLAETLDGRTILVAANAESIKDAEQALEVGADMVLAITQTDALPCEVDELSQRSRMVALLDKTSGKPLLIADRYLLAPTVVLEAGLRSDITLAVPPRSHLQSLGLGELTQELAETEADCLSDGSLVAAPRLAAWLEMDEVVRLHESATLNRFLEQLAEAGATRVLVSGLNVELLDAVAAAGNAAALPVIVLCTESMDDCELKCMVAAGVHGIVVPVTSVRATKEQIRELSFSECRETLLELIDRDRSEALANNETEHNVSSAQ